MGLHWMPITSPISSPYFCDCQAITQGKMNATLPAILSDNSLRSASFNSAFQATPIC